MSDNEPAPLVLGSEGTVTPLERLPRTHAEFDEEFMQELLARHPKLLPAAALRADAGQLLCVGREVPCSAGSIDNLYLSTGGYAVVVETKLWRNPQARREVLSQALDYTKDLTGKDYEWFCGQWESFQQQRQLGSQSLIAALNDVSDDEVEETVLVDRLHQGLMRGDILTFIVGDGIETRLQQLVAHLCRDSAHLRYSLALMELACYRMPGQDAEGDLLAIPRLVREVEAVERAYVRIELAPDLQGTLKVQSVAEAEEPQPPRRARSTLSEEQLLESLDEAIGPDMRRRVQEFYRDLAQDLKLELDFKAASLMVKVPDPNGERPGVSVLAIEREGRTYNSEHMRSQLPRLGLPEEAVKKLCGDYWGKLNAIDSRFRTDGIVHMITDDFLPLPEIADKLPAVREAIEDVVAKIRQAVADSSSQG